MDRLNGTSPITALTGLLPSLPISAVVTSAEGRVLTTSDDVITAVQASAVTELQNACTQLHKDLADASTQHRARRRHAASKGQVPNFREGDFVLVGRLASAKTSKLQLKWHGPFRIVAISSAWVYVVEDIANHQQHEVHSSRLKFYHDASLGVTAELKSFAHESAKQYEVSRLSNLRYNTEFAHWECFTHWRGFDDVEATWEPLHQLHEDVPALTCNFLDSLDSPDASLARQSVV